MLTIADFPLGYSSTSLADPYVPITKALEAERAIPSSPDGCHQIKVGALEEMLKVPLSAKNFFPRPGAGQSVYTQMVVHDSNAVARQVTSGDICANSWSKNSRGQTVERRMTDLSVLQGLPAGVRAYVRSWRVWEQGSSLSEYRTEASALVGDMGMHLETNLPVEIDLKQFESVFVNAVNRFVQAK